MLNSPAHGKARYEDLLALPDNVIGEILNGVVHTQPRPAPRHAHAASLLTGALVGSFDRRTAEGPGGWWILFEPESHLTDDVVVPDIAGWRKSTMAALPDTAWFDTTPDWTCEIISPSTAHNDRVLKREIYAREGVGFVWIVDPIARLLEAFELKEGHWVLRVAVGDDMMESIPPFEAMPLDLGRLWA